MRDINKTIFIITAGDYSDYRIIGACSNSEDAEKFKERFSGDEILEVPVDIPELYYPENYKRFFIEMLKNGDVSYIKETNYGELFFEYQDDRDNKFSRIKDEHFYGRVLARDEEHAIKIMNEKRTQYISYDWTSNIHRQL